MSLIHLMLIGSIQDTGRFYDVYAPYSLMFNASFLLLANFCAVFGLSDALIKRSETRRQNLGLENTRHRTMWHYTVATLNAALVFIALVSLYQLPKYSNQLFYRAKADITGATVSSLKISYYVANSGLIAAWVVASTLQTGE
jgi:hypothetical protein